MRKQINKLIAGTVTNSGNRKLLSNNKSFNYKRVYQIWKIN